MANLNDALRGMVSPEALGEMTSAVSQNNEASQVETKTSGALSPAVGVSFCSITGTQAFTLANGTRIGQRKQIRVTVAASTPDGTLTPATMVGGTSIDLDAVNEYVELMWTASGWAVVCIVGATINP